MSSQIKVKTATAKLAALSDQPAEQRALALSLLEKEHQTQVVLAALKVLTDTPFPTYRSILVSRFAYFQTHWSRYDQGAMLRTAILKALRPILRQDDQPILEQAIMTYEFLPPSRSEVAGPLRAIGLIALNDLNEKLVVFWATRLLFDEHTSPMSGEPAVTAARILGIQHQALPLYHYIMQPGSKITEVALECCKHLSGIPPSILRAIVGHYRSQPDEFVLLGVFDLVLAHEEWSEFSDTLRELMQNLKKIDIYRFVVMTLAASRREALLNVLIEEAQHERDGRKIDTLVEALALARGQKKL